MLLAEVGALAWYVAAQHDREPEAKVTVPEADPLEGLTGTLSMRATLKYFWTVGALLVVQVILGAVTAHYGVEGSGFYGIALPQWFPYPVTRTWHTQLGIFWIATAWLATGLFVAPAITRVEPKHQRFGVNFLFVCLLIIPFFDASELEVGSRNVGRIMLAGGYGSHGEPVRLIRNKGGDILEVWLGGARFQRERKVMQEMAARYQKRR